MMQSMSRKPAVILGTKNTPVHSEHVDQMGSEDTDVSTGRGLVSGLNSQTLIDIGYLIIQGWNVQLPEPLFRSLYSESAVIDFPLTHLMTGGQDHLIGFQGVKQLVKMWHTMYTDFRITMTGPVLLGPKSNQVTIKWYVSGVFTNGLGDAIKATNEYTAIDGYQILTLDQDCKIVHEQCLFDGHRALRLMKGEIKVARPAESMGLPSNLVRNEKVLGAPELMQRPLGIVHLPQQFTQSMMDAANLIIQGWNLQVPASLWKSIYDESVVFDFPLNYLVNGQDHEIGFDALKGCVKRWHDTMSSFRVANVGQLLHGPRQNNIMMKWTVNGVFTHDLGELKANKAYTEIEGVTLLTFNARGKIVHEMFTLDNDRLLRMLKGDLKIPRPAASFDLAEI